MGEIYEGDDLTLGVRVALKTIRREIAADPAAMERFRREMLLARQVTHPNICRLFDLFVHRSDRGEAVMFLTMELLDGQTLAEYLTDHGPLTQSEALPLIRQLASALEAAHSAGVVHRDFKTANVILASDPQTAATRVVVTDFGLARSVTATGNSLTGVAFVGTPAYMAPEQITGGEATPTSDIYAFGIVIYEMLTGVRPFTGDSALSIAVKRLQDAPASPRDHAPTLTTGWERVILKCLARRPEDRYASARDVIDALTESPAMTRRPGSGLFGRATAAALIVLLIVGGVFAGRRWRASWSHPPGAASQAPGRRSVAVLGFRNLSGQQQTAWVSTALAEMLTTELSTGGTLRTIPGENVARMKREFSLADTDSLAQDTLIRIRNSLGTDLIVLGSYVTLPNGQIRLDVRLQDASAGETLLATSATGTESGLFDLVVRAGAALRRSLGVAELQAAETDSLKTAVPTTPDAQKLYAEGLAKLRLFDAAGARDLLERAIVADRSFALAHSALAEAWARLGYQANASEEAKRAFELSGNLPREYRLLVEARYRAATLDWAKAAESYQTLFTFFPDNIEYGLPLVAAQTNQQKAADAFATIASLRRLPGHAASDPRIELAEADTASAVEDFRRKLAASQRAAAGAEARGARLLQAQAFQVQGSALLDLGETDKARASYTQARDTFSAAGDRGRVALISNSLGNLERESGNLAAARQNFESALGVFREIGARRVEGMVVGNLALIALDEGDLSTAIKGCRDALRIARDVGDRPAVGRHLNNLAVALWQRGDLAEAKTTLTEALALARTTGNKNTQAVILIGLGDVLLDQGQLADAQTRYEEGLAITRETGSRRFAAFALTGLGNASLHRDRLSDARARHEEAMSVRNEIRDLSGQADTRLALARLAYADHRFTDSEVQARQAVEAFRSLKLIFSEALADSVLATAVIPEKKLDDARAALASAQRASAGSQDPRIHIEVALATARLSAASGDLPGAEKRADAAVREARRYRIVPLEFETELAAAKITLASDKAAPARVRLANLAKQANAQGFDLIARYARDAIEQR